MDDIQGKIEYMNQLKAQGISGDELQERLSEFDAMDEEQQSNARSALTQLHLQDIVNIPDKDEQDNESNTLAAARIKAGTYDPERDSSVPSAMRSEAEQKQEELRQSLGLGPGVLNSHAAQPDKSKPEVDRSRLIVKGTKGTLGPAKVTGWPKR